MTLFSARIAALFLAMALASPTFAVDGVIEINAVRAAAGGVSATDTPGYPVTLDQPGSYRLTSNLAYSGSNTDIVEVTSGNVSLDLNGFEIRCIYAINPCAGVGRGIDAESAPNVTVRNGTVRDMGSDGLNLGTSSRVEGVHVIKNGGYGIIVGNNSAVANVHALANGNDGIEAGAGSVVSGCTAASNGGDGIDGGATVVIDGNTASNNAFMGIDAFGESVVTNNATTSNGVNGINVMSGTVRSYTANSNTANGIAVVGAASVVANTSTNNDRCGLLLSNSAGSYALNVLGFNNSGNANLQVSGGTEIGTNYCGGHSCGTGPDNACP